MSNCDIKSTWVEQVQTHLFEGNMVWGCECEEEYDYQYNDGESEYYDECEDEEEEYVYLYISKSERRYLKYDTIYEEDQLFDLDYEEHPYEIDMYKYQEFNFEFEIDNESECDINYRFDKYWGIR
jgi:hypothetical protein